MREDNNIPKGWVETDLGSLINIFNHVRVPLSAMVRNTRKGIYPYYGASNIVDYIDDYIFDGEYLLISEDGENLNTRNTPIAFIAKGKFWVNNHAHIIKGKHPHLTKYLELYFSKLDISSYITGAVQPKLSKGNLVNIGIVIPNDILEQQAIASILTTFDDKIELLQAQNQTLETIAQTIFKEWFGKYQVGDELPEGWRVGKLGNVVNLFDSQRIPLSKSQREERKGSYRYYGATNIMDYIDDYIFDGIYLLFAEDGSVIDENGNPVLQYVWGKFWVNNHAHIIQGTNGLSTELLYVFCKNMRVESIINGAVQLKINQRNLLGFDIVIPKKEFLLKLDNLIQPLFEKVRKNTQQIQTLQATRDTLLPKLMSGKVRVDEFKE